MKLKKLFALALCACMVLAVAPAALASGILSLGNDAVSTPEVVEQNPVVYNTRTTTRDFTPADHTAIVTKKSVSDAGDMITLESYVTGEQITISTGGSSAPKDIVLVLDYSASMLDNGGKDALIDALTSDSGFLNTVKSSAAEGSRIAAIAYGNSDGTIAIKSGSKNPNDLSGAFISVKDASAMSALSSAVQSGFNYSTFSDYGLAAAVELLQKYANSENDPVVIFMTDGIPGFGDWSGESAARVALNSIHLSKILKAAKGTDVSLDFNERFYNTSSSAYDDANEFAKRFSSVNNKGCGATVYSVGVALKANQSRTNEYLYRVSSHRPDSSTVGCKAGESGHGVWKPINAWENNQDCWYDNYPDSVTKGKTAAGANVSYYMEGSTSALKGMFSGIATDITTGGAAIDLDTETETVDVISQYFDIPTLPNNASAINVYVADCKTVNSDGKPTDWYSRQCVWDGADVAGDAYTIDVKIENGNQIVVSGFDYDEYWVGHNKTTGAMHKNGKKLIIEIAIAPKEGFLGGNDIPTNVDAAAGIFKDGNCLENFPNTEAVANVPVPDITVTAENKNIYLLDTVTDAQMLENASAFANGAVLDLDVANYGLAAWQYEFVNIDVSAQIDTTSPVFNGTADGKYTVKCSITSKTNGQNTKTGSANPNINVFKPTLAYPDYTVYLGNDPVIEPISTVWKHTAADKTETLASAVTMLGTAPELTGHTYSWTSGSAACNEAVVLTSVQIGDKPVTEYVTAKPFKVHVQTPNIQGNDKTIYLSNEVGTLSAKVSGWNKCSHTDAPAVTGTEPAATFTYSGITSDDTPDKCTNGTAILSKIGNAVLTDNQYKDEFDIHVLKPTVTGMEDTIKLGVEAPMAAKSEWNTTCGCVGELPTVSGAKPSVEYVYSKDNTNKYPVKCTEYTVTAKVGGKIYSDIKDTFKIHVETPVIDGVDKTIYRGNSTAVEANVVDWSPCGDKNVSRADDADPDATYTFSGGEVVSPAECTNYTAGLVQIGGVDLNGTEYTNEFTIHVLQPSINADDATIYYGTSIDLDGEESLSGVMQDVSWGGCTHNNVPAVGGTEPIPEYSFNIGGNDNKDTYSPEDCMSLTATWTLDEENFTDDFIVHVVKPTFTTNDITIYRGNSTDLNSQVAVAGAWKCTGNLLHGVQTVTPSTEAPAPSITYAFNDGAVVTTANPYTPTECKRVVTTPTVGNKTWTALPAFTVHVLQPTFTVETQDVWADYTNEVDLTAMGIKSSELVWKDQTTGHTTPTSLPAGAPTVSEKAFTFDKGTFGNYIVGTSDETVTASSLVFKLSNDYGSSYALDGKIFTIHVNKFDLIINKTWSGADVYKHDAIFNLYHVVADEEEGNTVENNDLITRIVLSNEQNSITIKGLLCGQKYTVNEEEDWSWRWSSDGEKIVTAEFTKHGVMLSNPHADMTNKTHEVAVTITNSLIKDLWFDFCTVVNNIFNTVTTKKGGN